MGVRLENVVRAAEGGVVIAVHVQPRAGTTAITGTHGDALKMRVAAPPVDGRATAAARDALAEAVGVAPSSVTLVSGERSRLKRFRVEGISQAEAIERLGHRKG